VTHPTVMMRMILGFHVSVLSIRKVNFK